MAEEKIKCPKCGTENNSNDNFCQECGNVIGKSENLQNDTNEQPLKIKIKGYRGPSFSSVIGLLINLGVFVFLPPYLLFEFWNSVSGEIVNFAYQGEYYTYHEAIHKHIEQAFSSNRIYIGMVLFVMVIFFAITNFLIINSHFNLKNQIDNIRKDMDDK